MAAYIKRGRLTMSTQQTVEVNAERYRKLEAMEAKQKLSARRSAVKTILLAKKAKDAGLTVSKAEIDARITADDAKKAPADQA
jgi:hypothetical protein